MIERVEKMHKRMEKAKRLLDQIVVAFDAEMCNWCIEEIDSDDERLAKMVDEVLDFSDVLREYANEMRG